MKTITSADVAEYEAHKFSAEASELGLKPGEWPEHLPTTLGNTLDFKRHVPTMHFGEVAAVMYHQIGGCISLKVFND